MTLHKNLEHLSTLLPIVVALLSCGVLHARGYTFGDQSNLTNNLFASYKKNLRPITKENVPTNINLGLWLVSIVDLEEVNQKLKFSAYIFMEWSDPQLSWNSTSYNEVKHFIYPQIEMWIPDVTITNSVETLGPFGFDRNVLGVSDNGIVQWLPNGVFSTSCSIDVTYYPFDTQKCQVILSTVLSTSEEMDLIADPTDELRLSFYRPSGTWDLAGLQVVNTDDLLGKPQITFTVTLKRLRSFYVISLVAPIVFLAGTATLVFALPSDTGEKMGASITILLAYAVYLSIISGQMPRTSLNVSVLSVYLTMLLGVTALGVILSAWTINLYFRDDDVNPPSVSMRKAAITMQRWVLCTRKINTVQDSGRVNAEPGVTSGATNSVNNNNGSTAVQGPESRTSAQKQAARPEGENPSPSLKGDDSRGVTWKMVSVTFDRFFFRIFTLLLLVATVVCLLLLIVGGGV